MFASRRNCIVQPHIISNIIYISNKNQPDICVADSCMDTTGYVDCERLMMRFADGVTFSDAILGAS